MRRKPVAGKFTPSKILQANVNHARRAQDLFMHNMTERDDGVLLGPVRQPKLGRVGGATEFHRNNGQGERWVPHDIPSGERGIFRRRYLGPVEGSRGVLPPRRKIAPSDLRPSSGRRG